MAESQNTEWKESWRDEYLKWICGVANAQGGNIYIGIDDNGNVIGLQDSKRLLEDIPNKVVSVQNIYNFIIKIRFLSYFQHSLDTFALYTKRQIVEQTTISPS